MPRILTVIGAILMVGIFSMLIPNVFAEHLGVTPPVFYSLNGTALSELKIHEKVNIMFTAKINDSSFNGDVFYNVIEGNNTITDSEKFTGSDNPKNFIFSYTPDRTGTFVVSAGMESSSDNFYDTTGSSFVVLENFSKAMKFDGQCKQPEYIPITKPDFSTNACVKHDTYLILKQRGWQ